MSTIYYHNSKTYSHNMIWNDEVLFWDWGRGINSLCGPRQNESQHIRHQARLRITILAIAGRLRNLFGNLMEFWWLWMKVSHWLISYSPKCLRIFMTEASIALDVVVSGSAYGLIFSEICNLAIEYCFLCITNHIKCRFSNYIDW